MSIFSESPRRRRFAFWRREPTLAERVIDAPATLIGRFADALSDLLSSLPFISWLRSDTHDAARTARRKAVQAATAAEAAAWSTARTARRDVARAASAADARIRGSATETFEDIADELDRLGGRAARLSQAAARRLRPRRRSWLESLWRGPTPGERAAESAGRASHLLTDLLAPTVALALSAGGRGGEAASRGATAALDAALDRDPPSLLSRLFPALFRRKSRRAERVKQAAAQAQAKASVSAAAALDEMEEKFSRMRRRAVALGDGETARSARRSLEKLQRLRLAVIEEPRAPGFLDQLSQALGAAQPSAPATVRGSLRLWPFAAERGASGLSLRADPTGPLRQSFGFAAAALAGAAAYAVVREALGSDKRARLDETEIVGPFGLAARAGEPGRGRDAASPSEIPAKGWKDILLRTWQEIGADRLLSISAGVVFYALLALFPAITALVSSYGLFASPATIGEHIGFLQSALPPGAFAIVQDQIQRVVTTADSTLGFSFVLGLALAIWSANAGMKAVIDALNIVYNEKEKRGFIKLNLVSLAFTLGALAAVLVGIAAIVVVPVLVNAFSFGRGEQLAWVASYARWPILIVMLMFGLGLLYRYGPSRTEPKWRWISVGSLAATTLWIVGSLALSYYISNFGDYDKTYGSLGAAIGMMMWMWLSAIVVLFGAELNSEIEHQTALDTTEGARKPIGLRGAQMADSIGAAQD